MSRERKDMTMIEMQPERFRIELVREAAARFDEPAWPRARDTVHLAGMKPVKVDGVRMIAAIAKMYSNAITFGSPDRGTWDPAIIGPGRELNPERLVFLLRNDLYPARFVR
jgi:hypothetical protein